MYIMAPEPISTAYFTNPSHQSLCLCVYPLIVARQQLGKNVTAVTNTPATTELLDVSFSMRFVLYKREVGDFSGGYKYGEIECWRGPAANLLNCTKQFS
jgi:hypothetical protein